MPSSRTLPRGQAARRRIVPRNLNGWRAGFTPQGFYKRRMYPPSLVPNARNVAAMAASMLRKRQIRQAQIRRANPKRPVKIKYYRKALKQAIRRKHRK